MLLAGGKGKANEEAVKLTLEVFSKINHNNFILIITGPWHNLKTRYNLPNNIILHGYVSIEELKKILAMSDYGLSPIFHHASGTFIKVLSYISSGLFVIASPQSLVGLDLNHTIIKRLLIVRNAVEFKKTILNVLSSHVYKDEKYFKDMQRYTTLCKKHWRRQ